MNNKILTFPRVAIAFVMLAMAFIAVPAASGAPVAVGTLNWSVQYMIDQSQTVLGNSQFSAPRDNRGLAVSPDGQYLYAGYNNGPEVRKIDLTQADYTDATVARTTVSRGKAIAVDDQGRVYLAEGALVKILDANLSAVQYSISAVKTEGVAVQREGGTLVVYVTERGGPNTLTRWELTESGGLITGAVKAGLDGDGVFTVPGASDMRGVAIDPAGRIWIADPSVITGNGKVFRLNSDGTGLVSNTAVPNPYAIAFLGNQVLVTGGYQRVISVLDMESLAITQTLIPPWTALKLDPDGNSSNGSITGIVVTSTSIYVTNEAGQTANDKSTYGRTDSQSGYIGADSYTDLSHDDNDPILKAMVLNQPPVVSSAAVDAFGDEGSQLSTAGSFTDPDGDHLTITGSGVIDNGDGTWSWTYTPTDNETGSVTVTADDGKGGTATDTFDWTAYNVTPDVTITAPADGTLNLVNANVYLVASYTDPGSADTHTYLIDWDDSSKNSGAASGGFVSGFHAYTIPGVYTIDVTVTDDDSGSDTKSVIVVVYDPNGGFVTGGGWIDSPVNEDYQYMQVGGKATFGFVSKYKKGATIPEGNTEFQFQAGGLNFHSTSYDWLVVNQGGSNAQFKGSGTINNAGNYGFMLWATDGTPDTFRIKIWDAATEAVVYDNDTNQPIGGGSIVIHKAK